MAPNGSKGIRDVLVARYRSDVEGLAKVGLKPRKKRKATREGLPASPAAEPVPIPPSPIKAITPSAAPVVVNGANGTPQQ